MMQTRSIPRGSTATIVVTVTVDGVAQDISGATLASSAQLKTETKAFSPVFTNTGTDGKVSIPVNTDGWTVGLWSCDVKLTEGSDVSKTAVFGIDVTASPTP